MGRVETFRIRTNKLSGTLKGSTRISTAKGVYRFDGNQFVPIKEIYAARNVENQEWRSNKVWEANPYILLTALDEYRIGSAGGSILDVIAVESYYESSDGTKNDTDYTYTINGVATDTIGKNTSQNSIIYDVVFTQVITGQTLAVKIVQDGDTFYDTVYEKPVVTSVEAATAEATGEDIMLIVRYSQKAIYQYASGNKEEIIYGTANPTITKGNTVEGIDVTLDGKYIKVPSAGTEVYDTNRLVYTVTGYSFTANGRTTDVTNASVEILQKPNAIESATYKNYFLNLTTNADGPLDPITNPNTYIYVDCHRDKTIIYTSGAEGDTVTENIEAILSSDDGVFDSTTVLGGSSTRFIPYENTSNESRTLTVNAYIKQEISYTDSIDFTQSGTRYVFNVSPETATIPYGGGSVDFTVISTRNGVATGAPKVSSSYGVFAVKDTIFDDINMDRYTVTIEVPENTTSYARSSTITFKQDGSNNELTANVSQAKAPEKEDINASATMVSYEVVGNTINYVFNVTADTSTIEGITIKLEDSPYGGNVFGEYTHEEEVISGDNIGGTLTFSNATTPTYLVAYYDNEIIGYGEVTL